jgi:hypothetical protein
MVNIVVTHEGLYLVRYHIQIRLDPRPSDRDTHDQTQTRTQDRKQQGKGGDEHSEPVSCRHFRRRLCRRLVAFARARTFGLCVVIHPARRFDPTLRASLLNFRDDITKKTFPC